MAYSDYLKSKDWQNKRARKLRRSRVCAVCGATKGLQVHHLFYRENLRKAEQSDLRVLCNGCHRLAHELIKAGELRINLSRVADHQQIFNKLKAGIVKACENFEIERRHSELDAEFFARSGRG